MRPASYPVTLRLPDTRPVGFALLGRPRARGGDFFCLLSLGLARRFFSLLVMDLMSPPPLREELFLYLVQLIMHPLEQVETTIEVLFIGSA